MTGPEATCRAVTGLIEDWRDGALGPGDSEPLEQHLLVCPPCLVQADMHRRALRSLGAVVAYPASPGTVERVLALLQEPAAT